MASSPAADAPTVPGNPLASAPTDIADMDEAIFFQRAIVASLEDHSPSADKDGQVQAAKAEISRLQKRRQAVRLASSQDSATYEPATMNEWNGSVSDGERSRFVHPTQLDMAGPGNHGSTTLPVRKRSYHTHLDGAQLPASENKSRRTTASLVADLDTPSSSPSTDGPGFIDLTGDDDDDEIFTALQRAREEDWRRNKEISDRDAEYARQLQWQGGVEASQPQPSTLAHHPGPSAHQRMMSASAQPQEFNRPTETLSGFVSSFARARGPHQPSRHHSPALTDSPLFTGHEDMSELLQAPSSQPPPRAVAGSNMARLAAAASSGNWPGQSRMPGSFDVAGDDSDGEIEYLDSHPVVPQASSSGHDSTLAGAINAPMPPLSTTRGRRARPRSSTSSIFRSGGPASEPAARATPGDDWHPQTSTTGLWGHGASNAFTFGSFPNSSVPPPSISNYHPGPDFASPFHSGVQAMPRPGALDGGVYNFFRTGLASVPGSSTLNSIIQRTSMFDFDSMVDGLGNSFSPQLRSYMDYIVNDPRKNTKEIQDLLATLRPDMEIPQEERGDTPPAMRYPLYTHQLLALKWMKDMEDGTHKGGILADEMGLGKTISTLALLVSRPSTDKDVKTNLIIGPVALIRQWQSEIRKKLNRDHSLSVFLFHGRKATYEKLRTFDVVLTTYGTVGAEYKRYDKYRKSHAAGDADDDERLAKLCPLLHRRSVWHRIVLDESQCIKNKDTQGALGTHELRASYRWCLTGTPMMNGVHELYSLIRFLRIKPYMVHKRFAAEFSALTPKSKSSEAQRSRQMQMLRALLRSIMLRRMKDSTIDGRPILSLPPKNEEVVHVVFSDDEKTFYTDLEQRSRTQFNKYLRSGTVGKNYSNILVLLLRLRQACCHPHLNMDFETVGGDEESREHMRALAATLDGNVVDRIKAIEAFECPICYDAALNPSLVTPCGHDTCRGCLQQLTENYAQQNLRNGQEGDGGAKCPQCRGPIDPAKTIDYHAFVTVHMPEKADEMGLNTADATDDDGVDEDSMTEDSSDDGASSEVGHVAEEDDADELGNLRGFIVPDDDDGTFSGVVSGDEAAGEDVKAAVDVDEPFKEEKKKKSRRGKKDKKSKGKGKGKEKMAAVKPHMLKALRKEANKNQKARRRYMRYLRKNWETSAKVDKACELLRNIQETGEKTIIFSVWAGLLDLLEIPIKKELQLKYRRYDGSMTAVQRDAATTEFTEDDEVKVMLVSLKAGNAGLNLTVASRVIIMDPFWNPFVEMQAVDRAHRIGQQRPVHVYRILVQKTVEDRIIELQERKRDLVNSALDEGESRNLGRLSHTELGYLFGVQC